MSTTIKIPETFYSDLSRAISYVSKNGGTQKDIETLIKNMIQTFETGVSGFSKNYEIGQCLIPLTVKLVQERYIKKGNVEKIEHIAPQSSADRLRIVAVNGKSLTVIEEYQDGDLTADLYQPKTENLECVKLSGTLIKNEKLIKKWLQKNEPGPYKKIGDEEIFSLEIKECTAIDIPEDATEGEMCLQISSKPLNVLSYDAIDSANLWVKK